MGHDPDMIYEARGLLQRVLNLLPSHIFILVTLHTLTLLSISSLLYVPQQIELLLNYLKDPRQKIRLLVYRDLRRIVDESSHYVNISSWPIDQIINELEQNQIISIRISILLLFRSLFKFFGNKVFSDENLKQKSIHLFEVFLHDKKFCFLASEVLSFIVTNDDEILHFFSSICLGLQKILLFNNNYENQKNQSIDIKEIQKIVFVLASLVKGHQNAEIEFVNRFIEYMDLVSDIEVKSIFAKGIHFVIKNTSESTCLLPYIKKIINHFLPHHDHENLSSITVRKTIFLFICKSYLLFLLLGYFS